MSQASLRLALSKEQRLDVARRHAGQIAEVLGERLYSIILYGSTSRGDFGPESDIDLLILYRHNDFDLSADLELLNRLALPLSLDAGLELSHKLLSVDQWRDRHSFYHRNVRRDGITLILMAKDERIERIRRYAQEALKDAERALQENAFNAAVNRAYYAAFHATQALLQLHDVYTKTHQGAKRKFHELFLKTGILPLHFGEKLATLSDYREMSDYDYEQDVTLTIAQQAVAKGREFVEGVFVYLDNTP